MGCCLSARPLPPCEPPQKRMLTGELLIRTQQFLQEHTDRLDSYYRLETQLGYGTSHPGAFGRVFEATHLSSGARRAVKIIPRDKIEEKQLGQMISEVSILKTLDHPHILKVYEVFVESASVSIVSELCTGGELFEKITKLKRFSEQMGSTYMQQILSAVAYCHDRGIVHRDLKPENLLLENPSANALLKVIDFGTSSKVAPGSQLHNVLGTPYYIAPEVLSRKYNEKCDVWSLGVVLYILLSGSPPFTGSSDKEVLRKVHLGYYDFDSRS